MRLNAKELIADARVTAPNLPPAAAKLMSEMADRLDVQFVALCESRDQVKQLAAESAELKDIVKGVYPNLAIDVSTEAVLASLRAEGVADDYFGGLVTKARASAGKAMLKFPQPNYVLLKVAEEAGEVVQAGVHYAENRMTWQDVEGEIIQLLAMLIRLVTEGDQVNGITPPALCQSAPSSETEAIARQFEQVKGVQS
ncbi:hypothetical protein WKI40_23335 [Kosakonia sacchari]|uniref:hypothetical protein n=1 Tax=Kosakonia sacchari TaxID=1158459 RepID=UPI0030BF4C05